MDSSSHQIYLLYFAAVVIGRCETALFVFEHWLGLWHFRYTDRWFLDRPIITAVLKYDPVSRAVLAGTGMIRHQIPLVRFLRAREIICVPGHLVVPWKRSGQRSLGLLVPDLAHQHPPAFAHQLTAHQGPAIGMAEDLHQHLDRQVLVAEHQTVVAFLVEHHAGTRGSVHKLSHASLT